MASFLDKLKIKTAVDNRTKLDLGCDHISTANWMQYNVAYNKELVPREKIDVNMETFVRMLPLTRPTFGRAHINNRAFFVPYRAIWDGWTDFITDTLHYNGTNTPSIGSNVPSMTEVSLTNLFINESTLFTHVTSSEIPAVFDVAWYSSTEQTYHYGNFTARGRQVYKILLSLGYGWNWTDDSVIRFSALPLLAIAKVYCDWYYPTQYLDNIVYANVQKILTRHDANGYTLSGSDLVQIFNLLIYVMYDTDYFTSSWNNPSGPSNNNYSTTMLQDVRKVTSTSGTVNSVIGYAGNVSSATTGQNSADGTPVISRIGSTGFPGISDYLLTALKSLTDYMKRHQLVGARALDRYLARFGVSLDSEKSNRSLYLGNYKVPIQIGDIMSTANSDGIGLGDYAGKGVGYGQGHFDFETEEFGQFIIISTIIPAQGYYQGVDRNVLHINKLDYFTPEFDNLGVQAISQAELYIMPDGKNSTHDMINPNSNSFNEVFGWTPRYAEYKVAKDRVTGDFRVANLNVGEDSWYLMRDVSTFYDDNAAVNGVVFQQGRDWEQYNRIFQNVSNKADAFKVIYHFEIASYSPMKALFDTYEFEDKGKEVTEDVNGIKMN